MAGLSFSSVSRRSASPLLETSQGSKPGGVCVCVWDVCGCVAWGGGGGGGGEKASMLWRAFTATCTCTCSSKGVLEFQQYRCSQKLFYI